MQTCVERFFQQDVPLLTSQLGELEMRVEPLAFPENDSNSIALEGIMSDALQACRQLDAALGSEDDLRKEAQSRFRLATAPWCDQSWIIHRARSKPRGFPGDYQMLLAIYDGVPIARGFGGYLDRLCLKLTLGNAVRSRLKDAREFLVREIQWRDGPVEVLNIASGPGREFQHGFGLEFPCPAHITCIDSDQGALEYVRRHVSANCSPNLSFTFSQHNALKMRSVDSVIKQFGRQDIIYSVGLADYIPDRLLIPMLSSWKEALHPGGCLYVAFKDMNYYDKVEYQWLMDWHFLQRDEGDCIRLLEQAGFDMDSVESHRDETGVIINYLARAKTASSYGTSPMAHPSHSMPACQHATVANQASEITIP
jgi:hypothetical protein